MSYAIEAGLVAPVETDEANKPEATPENVAALPDDTQAPEDVKTEAGDKKFTQAELNEIIQKEKAKAEAKAERRALKAYRETLERFAPQQPQAPTETGRPSREQFATDEDWVEAVTDWKLEKRDRAANQQQQAQRQQSVASKTEGIYAEAARIPGFDREAFDDLPLTPAIASALIESEVSAKLMAHLAANPDAVERIASLSPARQAAEIGKLEVAITSAPKVSKAPPPITPIGGAKGSVSKEPSEMTDKEFAAWRRAQIAQRR